MPNRRLSSLRSGLAQGIVLVFVGLSLVLLLLWGIDCQIIQPVFLDLQRKQGLEDSNRAWSGIENEIASLAAINKDWGYWDDTYEFAHNRNREFIESNYPDPAMISRNSGVDLLLIYDEAGVELLKGIFCPEKDREIALEEFSGNSPPVLSLIASGLSRQKAMSGLMQTEQGLLLLVACPILNSQAEGPARGTLIMGRFLSRTVLKTIAERMSVPFELFVQGDERLTPDEQSLFAHTAAADLDLKPVFRQGYLYRAYLDIAKKPGLLLRTPLRGEMTALGRRTGDILSLSLGLIALCLLVCLAAYRFRMKTSEQALGESEERYRNLFENKHTVMLLIDPDTGAIVDANPAACTYYGWSREDMMEKKIDEINTLTHEETFAEMSQARSEKRTHFLFKHRLANGTVRDVEVYSGPLTLKGKALLYSIIHDITERIQGEAERSRLEARNRQLRKAESLGRMAGAIAHLFNNHLTVVLGNLEMALDDLPEDAQSREQLGMAMEAARRSSEISGMMLTYLGKNTDKSEILDLSEVCRLNLPLLGAAIPKGIVLDTDLVSPGPVVRANATQMQKVLHQLLTNSWEAIGDCPGKITLATRTVAAADLPKVHIVPTDVEANVETFACLEVTDTGCGMTEESLERIFDPFFTTKFAGRGLGLPIILGIVKKWGGMIGVESTIGQGSAFRIFLPLVVDMPSPLTEKSTEIIDILKGGTVLLVEDQDPVRETTKTLLERLHFKVITTANGNEAISLYRRHRDAVTCVITDHTMPGMDGWETLIGLRAINPQLRIILVSGYDEAQVMNSAYAEQPDAFLHKPFSINELENALRRALR